jgi:hypothetical protein
VVPYQQAPRSAPTLPTPHPLPDRVEQHFGAKAFRQRGVVELGRPVAQLAEGGQPELVVVGEGAEDDGHGDCCAWSSSFFALSAFRSRSSRSNAS